MADTPNFDDANFALRLYELRREPELRKARAMVGDLLDGATWETMQAVREYDHPENAHFRQVTSYWEIAASFVNRGIFHPDVFLDTCGEAFYTYCVLKPHIEKIREAGSPRFMVQLEKIVQDHPASRERVETIEKMMAVYRLKQAADAAAKAAADAKKKKPKPKDGKKSAKAKRR